MIFFAASHNNDVVFASTNIARSQIETFFAILSENEMIIFGYFIWRGYFIRIMFLISFEKTSEL
jgi:hypothetical protein